MHALLGRSLILIALFASCFGLSFAFVAGKKKSLRALVWAEAATHSFTLAMLLANFVMIRALLQHDFEVSYVAQVGSRDTPTWITVVSLWSSLEGSILLWGAILGLYLSGFVCALGQRHRNLLGYTLGVALCIAAFFALMLASPANPFQTLSPIPADGPGPNPLLQNHLLMIVHPPMLYLGYVGMVVPFAIASSALLNGQLPAGWMKELRRWTMIPWTFLSIGIVLGGWWAYEVLGWGGYWAWDPVENASFLPWLCATAYLHSTLLHERKGMLKAWTMALVMCTFLLTILGTFMTRSGIFNSVHSFTQSSIGPLFLGLLAICSIFTIILLTLRAGLLEDEQKLESWRSREMAFYLNNGILVLFTFTVLLGTVYPLLLEAINGTRISVGEPYFDQMAMPIGMLLVFLMGVGPLLPWGQVKRGTFIKQLLAPSLVAVSVGVMSYGFGAQINLTLGVFALCAFAGTVTIIQMFQPIWMRKTTRGKSWLLATQLTLKSQRRKIGGYIVHLGILLIVASIACSHTYRKSGEAKLEPGQSFTLGNYKIEYTGAEVQRDTHRFKVNANIALTNLKNNQTKSYQPSMNYYPQMREPIGSPVVASQSWGDIYLSLLAIEPQGIHATFKVFLIPMVPYLWFSLVFIVLGSLLALFPKKIPLLKKAPDPEAQTLREQA